MSDDYLTVNHHITDLIVQLIVDAPAQCRVDWGDGATETVAATSSTPHTYAKPGNFKVTVTGGSGLRQSFSVVAGSPMPAWRAQQVADNVRAPIEDAASIAATTSRLG